MSDAFWDGFEKQASIISAISEGSRHAISGAQAAGRGVANAGRAVSTGTSNAVKAVGQKIKDVGAASSNAAKAEWHKGQRKALGVDARTYTRMRTEANAAKAAKAEAAAAKARPKAAPETGPALPATKPAPAQPSQAQLRERARRDGLKNRGTAAPAPITTPAQRLKQRKATGQPIRYERPPEANHFARGLEKAKNTIRTRPLAATGAAAAAGIGLGHLATSPSRPQQSYYPQQGQM